jgi:hypothetical protein
MHHGPQVRPAATRPGGGGTHSGGAESNDATRQLRVPAAAGLSQVIGCESDLTAPTITGLRASPNVLWPPNHKIWNVAVSYTARDNCGGAVTCRLSVTSDEPVNSIGDGNTLPDWVVVSVTQVRLRAERQSPMDGREYTITVTCTDAANNTARRATTVSAPHDQRK